MVTVARVGVRAPQPGQHSRPRSITSCHLGDIPVGNARVPRGARPRGPNHRAGFGSRAGGRMGCIAPASFAHTRTPRGAPANGLHCAGKFCTHAPTGAPADELHCACKFCTHTHALLNHARSFSSRKRAANSRFSIMCNAGSGVGEAPTIVNPPGLPAALALSQLPVSRQRAISHLG